MGGLHLTTYYVGPGGNDGNAGTSWALRKLTLNGAEDIPVVANDTVYVGPGVYREMLTVDVSGGAGTEITYIADVTGEHTDGVGGAVRVTGSDNDTTPARNNCIVATGRDYRTFRGFWFDLNDPANDGIRATNCAHWIVEDCCFQTGGHAIRFDGASSDTNVVRRCVFATGDSGVSFWHSSTLDDSGHLVENCLFLGYMNAIYIRAVGGITVRNCTFIGSARAVLVQLALSIGQTTTVNNCILACLSIGLQATAVGEITEDFNSIYQATTARTNTNVGGNSNTYPPLFLMPILHAGASQANGYQFPWIVPALSEWSQIRAITGSNEPAVDLRGIVRPATASKNSWGTAQFHDMERETGTTRGGSTASLVLHDAARHPIFIPVAASSITVSVYVYREANYAGGNPQMVIKQPGQADRTTTDAGAASAWNELTDTFTPAANPPYVTVELVSNNTAGAGNYDVFFDDLTATPTNPAEIGSFDYWLTDRLFFEDKEADQEGGGTGGTRIYMAGKSYDKWRPNQALLLDLQFKETNGTVTADWAKGYRPKLTLVDTPVWSTLASDLTYLGFANNDAIYSLAADSTDVNFTSGAFSGAVWISPTAYGNRYLFDKSSATAGWAFWICATSPYLAFITAQAGPTTQITYGGAGLVTGGVWQFVGFTRDGADVRIYLNGSDVTDNPATHVNPATAAAINTYIGAAVGAAAGWFNGGMWRPRIWGRALDSWEFTALYNAEKRLFGL